MYLVMVAVIVGLNYRLRGRHSSERGNVSNEGQDREQEEMENDETIVKTASVSFSEGKGSYSSLAPPG